MCLNILSLAIESAFTSRTRKQKPLEKLRVHIEMLKHLIRTANEISVYSDKTYIHLQKQLQEISKMNAGWIKFIQQHSAN